jgi:hypothetical protein
MIPKQTKKSPRWQFGDRAAGGSGRKQALYVLFIPARRGTTSGPFSFEIFEIIAQQEGFINE